MQTFLCVLKSARPPFLILALVCVGFGAAIAYYQNVSISLLSFLLASCGALSAHISVNCFNEYFDFKSGLDLNTVATPFSGGSKSLPSNPSALTAVLVTAVLSLILCLGIGIYFLTTQGQLIVPIGLLGMFVIVAYTSWLNKSPLLCWLSPGVGFGLLIAYGSYVVQAQQYNWFAFYLCCLPFLLSNNLLLLNQFPDIEADKKVGRNHIPIACGRRFSAHLYGGTFIVAMALVLAITWRYQLSYFTLSALVPLSLGLALYRKVLLFKHDIPRLIPFMAMNVVITLITPILMAGGLLFS